VPCAGSYYRSNLLFATRAPLHEEHVQTTAPSMVFSRRNAFRGEASPDDAGGLSSRHADTMRIVAPFGFYGWGNIGDEATLNGFARLLALKGVAARVWVGSRNPGHCARAEPAFSYFDVSRCDPRRWWAKLRASAQAVVGGTPIADILGDWPLCELVTIFGRSTYRRNPIAFIGVGTETLRLEKSRRIFIDQIAPRVSYWSVRSDADRERLLGYGLNHELITVAADLAWLIEPPTNHFGKECLARWGFRHQGRLIGVNVVNENSLFEKDPNFVTELASALDAIITGFGVKVIFLSNEIRPDACFDNAAAQRVASQMRHSEAILIAPREYLAPREMMSVLSCCDATVSMRYHFCIFSALQGVPFFAIARSGKLSDLCVDLEWPYAAVPSHLDSAALTEVQEYFTGYRSSVLTHLQPRVEVLRTRALRNLESLQALNAQASREARA
jgi:polysaccharide pyruvyl transferase WcaK-like protein